MTDHVESFRQVKRDQSCSSGWPLSRTSIDKNSRTDNAVEVECVGRKPRWWSAFGRCLLRIGRIKDSKISTPGLKIDTGR